MARLYSSWFYNRPEMGTAYAAAAIPPSAFSAFMDGPSGDLKNFIGYKQADWRGRQRMEQMESMGLPYNTDPSRVRLEPALTYAMGGRPIYSTSMPMPFGTWGGGMKGGREEEPVPTPPVAESSEKEIPSNAMGVSGSPLAFTRFGPTAGINPNLASPFAGGFGNSRLTGFGSIPRFPFAGY